VAAGRSSDNPRCGKFRAVADTLQRLPRGQWLFFIDADLGLRTASAAASPHCKLDARATQNATGHCRLAPGGLFRALLWTARRAARKKAQPDPSIVSFAAGANGDFMEFMAFRHDVRGREWLARFLVMQESRPWICNRFTTPENIYYSIMPAADKCAVTRVEGLDLVSHVNHLMGSQPKGDEDSISRFVRQVDEETSCVQQEARKGAAPCIPLCRSWQPCLPPRWVEKKGLTRDAPTG
jgi:hypothetical protein